MCHVDGDQLPLLAISRLNKFHLPKLHKAKPEVNLCLTTVFVGTKQCDNRRGTFGQLLCSVECVAVNVPHVDLPHHKRPKSLLEDGCVGLS